MPSQILRLPNKGPRNEINRLGEAFRQAFDSETDPARFSRMIDYFASLDPPEAERAAIDRLSSLVGYSAVRQPERMRVSAEKLPIERLVAVCWMVRAVLIWRALHRA